MSLYCKKSGILSTVQDLGRFGYRRLGINTGGVMDRDAARLANILLGNPEDAPVIEMHFPCGEWVFEADAIFALAGADFDAVLDECAIPPWKEMLASAGSRLSFRSRRAGTKAYLAVAGGFLADVWLGSSSTNLTASAGGSNGQRILSGDRVAYGAVPEPRRATNWLISRSLIPHYSRFPTVRVLAGDEFASLAESSKRLFLEGSFEITPDSNRMGYRLNGEELSLTEPKQMISSAVGFGTIQLLPDGQLILLMADHQTSGGYPRVAHVISRDLPLAAQLGPGDRIAFALTDQVAAENAVLEFERQLRWLKAGVSVRKV